MSFCTAYSLKWCTHWKTAYSLNDSFDISLYRPPSQRDYRHDKDVSSGLPYSSPSKEHARYAFPSLSIHPWVKEPPFFSTHIPTFAPLSCTGPQLSVHRTSFHFLSHSYSQYCLVSHVYSLLVRQESLGIKKRRRTKEQIERTKYSEFEWVRVNLLRQRKKEEILHPISFNLGHIKTLWFPLSVWVVLAIVCEENWWDGILKRPNTTNMKARTNCDIIL